MAVIVALEARDTGELKSLMNQLRDLAQVSVVE